MSRDGRREDVDQGKSREEAQRDERSIEVDVRAAVTSLVHDEPLTGKAATQERILLAATELFLTRGYENTTIAHVAEHAEVSRATVFWHFSDKESLFRECFNRLCEPFRQSLARDMSALAPEKRLREQVELYQTFVAGHRADVDGFIRWAIEHSSFRDWLVRTLYDLHHRFGGALAETLSEIVPREVDPHAVAMGILMMLDGNLLLSYYEGSPRAAEQRQASIQAILELVPRRSPARL